MSWAAEELVVRMLSIHERTNYKGQNRRYFFHLLHLKAVTSRFYTWFNSISYSCIPSYRRRGYEWTEKFRNVWHRRQFIVYVFSTFTNLYRLFVNLDMGELIKDDNKQSHGGSTHSKPLCHAKHFGLVTCFVIGQEAGTVRVILCGF